MLCGFKGDLPVGGGVPLLIGGVVVLGAASYMKGG
jgi:hypothetical protein